MPHAERKIPSADACMSGIYTGARLWARAVRGAEGVAEVMGHFHTELVRAMQLSGTPTLADAAPDLLASR